MSCDVEVFSTTDRANRPPIAIAAAPAPIAALCSQVFMNCSKKPNEANRPARLFAQVRLSVGLYVSLSSA